MQILAMLMIMAEGYFGVTSGASDALRLGVLTYAGSSLLGYFNAGTSPMIRLCRINFIPVILAVVTLIEMFNGNGSGLVMLLITHIIDIVIAINNPNNRP
jgi:hypothetical protein